MNIYKIADLNIGIENPADFTKEYMKDYETSECECDFSVTVTDEMIAYEKEIAEQKVADKYYELTGILRQICKVIVEKYDGFFLHCSALSYKNEAYIFTAKSGTGKSTHARLWREVFGDEVTMINDDKPIIRLIDGKYYIYGTPWNGKHHLSNNIKVPIKTIYYLYQSKENKVEKCDALTAISKLISQTVLPDDKNSMNNLLDMLVDLLKTTPMFDLWCDISHDAVYTALNSIKE